MPALTIYSELIESLTADIMVAWPDTRKVFAGRPRTVQAAWPYAVILLDEEPVAQDWDSVQGLTQVISMLIVRVASVPLDKTVSIQGLQVTSANALIARLERNHMYLSEAGAGLGTQPVGRLAELPEPEDKTFETVVRFTLNRRELHTSKQ